MSEAETENQGRHAAPDDDPNSDPPPTAGEGGEHAAEDSDDSESSGDETEDGEDGEGHGTRYPGADPEDKEEIEEDREKRLDPDNRPDGAEIDNSDRDFDAKKGMFTDTDGYDQAEEKFPALGEEA
jgi:hypothetical protein